jgi:hypothetical protein
MVAKETHEATARLERAGLLRREGEGYRTTARWQGAMARAAARLLAEGDEGKDLRVPVAHALVELFGADCPDDDLVRLVEVMTPIEAGELDPRLRR